MQYDWLDKAAYPFQARYAHLNGQQMHYIDEGQGEVLLFVHGTPSWSFDYRHIIQAFKAHYRCIAMDHIGFGLSDKPADYDYSTQRHSQTLEAFIEAQQLTDITLVVHDFGGPIGLQVALRHPERIKRLVILNSWLWSSREDPAFIKLSKILRSPLLPFLYRYLNFSARFILPGAFGKHKLPKHIRRQYTKPFANPRQREGTLAFAYSLLNDQDWFDTLWQQRAVLASKPCLLIWGMADPVVTPRNLDRFAEAFPEATITRLPDCGHFPQEECAQEVIAAMRSFLAPTNPA